MPNKNVRSPKYRYNGSRLSAEDCKRLNDMIAGGADKRNKRDKLNEIEAAMDKRAADIALTPEIMHELIEQIVVHASDKSSGHRTQEIGIHYRFDVAVATAVADSMKYDKKRKAA